MDIIDLRNKKVKDIVSPSLLVTMEHENERLEHIFIENNILFPLFEKLEREWVS